MISTTSPIVVVVVVVIVLLVVTGSSTGTTSTIHNRVFLKRNSVNPTVTGQGGLRLSRPLNGRVAW